MSVVRIGILSTADIGQAIVHGVCDVPNAKVIALSSRDITKARNKAVELGIQYALTHDELIRHDEVDAVFIPLPTAKACDWAVRATHAGKHVLVDKPFFSADAVRTMCKACTKANIIFLDGTHFVHANRSRYVREAVERGDIGDVSTIMAPFHAPVCKLSENIRGDVSLEPMGALGDLCWYSVRAVVTFLGINRVDSIKSIHVSTEWDTKIPGLITSVQGAISFEGWINEDDKKKQKPKVTTKLIVSNRFRNHLLQNIDIIGTTGAISFKDFVVPREQTWFYKDLRPKENFNTQLSYSIERGVKNISGKDLDDFEVMYPTVDHVVTDKGNEPSQVSKMIQEFCRMINEKDMEASRQWGCETLATQTVLDTIFQHVQSQRPDISE